MVTARPVSTVHAVLGLLALAFALSLLPPTAQAQSVRLSGFIKSSYYYDTRQVVGAREGDFMLYPAPKAEATDTDNLLFFPFFSRLRVHIEDVPEALGARVTGLIETDFFGFGNSTLNSLRIRRAFVKMDWGTHEALFGMEWTPFFLSSWAQTVATEAGAPFNPFARYPQIQFTLKPQNFRLTGILAQQRDAFQEIGGLKQQQQSGLPGAMLSAEYINDGFQVGANAYIKAVRPTLLSDRFTAGAVQGFITVQRAQADLRANVTYGGDLADHLMTGGYAGIDPDGVADGSLDDDDFEPLDLLAAWLDVQSKGPLSVGLFGGYLQNLGTSEDNIDLDAVTLVARGYGLGSSIETVWRFAPRMVYNAGRVRFAGEVQVTSADYVPELDDSLAPDGEAESVTNVRGNLSVFLFF